MYIENENQNDLNTNEPWEKIYSSISPPRVELLRSLLENEGIPAVIVNKQDSMYVMIGEVELYTKRDYILKAKNIIEKTEL